MVRTVSAGERGEGVSEFGNMFSIDYGRKLADVLLRVNWKYLDALEKTAKDDNVERGYVSMRMTEIQRLWNNEVKEVCQTMIEHMNQTVAAYQKMATDALSVAPLRPFVIKGKVEEARDWLGSNKL